MSELNAAFWKWFGKSKVVNPDGSPMIVYRGDIHEFEKFDRSKTREEAFFFTPDKRVARIYARDREPRAYFLRAEKLIDLFSESHKVQKFILKWAEDFDDWIDRRSGEEIDPRDVVASGELFDFEGDWSSYRWRSLQRHIQNNGYDGAALPDIDGGQVFPSIVVFKPNQIKAVDNDGSWDLNDDNVLSNPRKRR